MFSEKEWKKATKVLENKEADRTILEVVDNIVQKLREAIQKGSTGPNVTIQKLLK